MNSILPSPNIKPDRGNAFLSGLLKSLPFSGFMMDADQNNSRYELFHRVSQNREMRTMNHSVIINSLQRGNPNPPFGFGSDMGYHNYIYAKIDTDKSRRLAEYRRMAAYAEISDCLDEICDDFITKDETGKVIKIDYKPFCKLDQAEKTEVEKEFYRFVDIFELEKKGWGYCRSWLTEGEVFFENIIHEKRSDLGIIGVLKIPGELINPVYDNIQNNIIQNFVFQKPIIQEANGAVQRGINPSNVLQHQIITLEGKQITYIHSGIWNDDFTIRIPFIENCRRAYKQVSLLEDSILIYRMVRAPERLKFKIDIGGLPPDKGEAYFRRIIQEFRTKKVYDGAQSSPGAQNIYNPESMLDSYFFAKRKGEEGSDVELLQGGGNLGENSDLLYFVKKLYQSLKVPQSRINPDTGFRDGADILREELRFAKFIIRIQNAFADGIKQSFVTHLKLKGMWDRLKMKESFFDLNFVPPSSYFAVREQQLFELKYNNFNNMSQNESISPTFAQRHYMNMSDEKISENQEWRRKDAALRWELGQIEQLGPNWRDQLKAAQEAASADNNILKDDGGSPMMGGGASSTGNLGVGTPPDQIPEFGDIESESPPDVESEPPDQSTKDETG